MMMKFLKLLFCFPMMLMLGVPVAGESSGDDGDGKADGAEGAGSGDDDRSDEESGDDDGEETVSMTKAELKQLIDETFSKGSRKGRRELRKEQAGKGKAENDKGESGDDEAEKKAAALIQKANDRMLSGTVKSIAADVGITGKGAKAALRLADFSDCIKDDDVDEESVKDVLEDFLKEYPEFSTKNDDDEQKSWGMRHGGGQKMSGVEAAFYARNPDLKK